MPDGTRSTATRKTPTASVGTPKEAEKVSFVAAVKTPTTHSPSNPQDVTMATLLQRIEIMFKENTNTQNKTNEGFKNTLDQVDSRLKNWKIVFPPKLNKLNWHKIVTQSFKTLTTAITMMNPTNTNSSSLSKRKVQPCPK
jgi:hypothetical protein